LAYLVAGAQCIATASYQASLPGLAEVGYAREKAEALMVESVALAQQAVAQAKAAGTIDFTPLIAASVGPYGAYLADGSEYRGNYGVSDAQLRDFHRDRLTLL
ncbi:MAG TPA: homocysteine S-methyltransferase, partial [Cytophagales bacterium]|nr:homocysteine S-methyltransferase [Cytophagales bacterium]